MDKACFKGPSYLLKRVISSYKASQSPGTHSSTQNTPYARGPRAEWNERASSRRRLPLWLLFENNNAERVAPRAYTYPLSPIHHSAHADGAARDAKRELPSCMQSAAAGLYIPIDSLSRGCACAVSRGRHRQSGRQPGR